MVDIHLFSAPYWLVINVLELKPTPVLLRALLLKGLTVPGNRITACGKDTETSDEPPLEGIIHWLPFSTLDLHSL